MIDECQRLDGEHGGNITIMNGQQIVAVLLLTPEREI